MAATLEDLETKIIDLQIRYTHQQDTINALDEVIRDQQNEIDQLKRMVNELRHSIEHQGAVETGSIMSEKPPHY
jgi:SlyX protein